MNLFQTLPAISTILAIFFLALTTQQSTADIKAATVDVNQLMADYHVVHKQISMLKAERDEYAKERDDHTKSLKEVVVKLKPIIAKLKDKTLLQAARDVATEEYEDLVSQHSALSKDLKESDMGQVKDIKEKLAVATRALLDEIQVVIHQYAKDNGYQWIIDTSGVTNTQISPLVYIKDAKDVTAEVLAVLNKDAPKEEDGAKPQTPKTNPK